MSGRFPLKARECLGSPARKRAYNELHFAETAPRYDLATRAMSLGRDAAWKRRLVEALPEDPSPLCVDLACGTGDVSFLLAERYPHGSVIGVDISPQMLSIGRKRNRYGNVRFTRCDMCVLPFPDASVDVLTGAYALRNAPLLGEALAEARRVLRPGGTAAFLDFAKPPSSSCRPPRYWLLRGWGGLWGLLLHGNLEIHGYIAESLIRFPDREGLRLRLREAGFTAASSRRFFLGILELVVLRRGPIPCAGSIIP